MLTKPKSSFDQFIEHSFFQDHLVLPCILVHLGLNLINWAILGFGLKGFHDYSVPLHYTILGGVDVLGEWYRLLTIPLTGLIILIVNVTLGFFAYKRERLLSYFFVGIGLLAQVLILVVSIAFLKLVRG